MLYARSYWPVFIQFANRPFVPCRFLAIVCYTYGALNATWILLVTLLGSCTLNLKLAGNAAVSTARPRCRQMCRRWRNNHTVPSNYDLRFCSRHLMTNTSKGHVLLCETYRGIPTRFTNMNKAANTRTRIMFIVQAHTPCRHLLSYMHLCIISTLHHSCIFHRIGIFHRLGIFYFIDTFTV